jgi:hypothetical protein
MNTLQQLYDLLGKVVLLPIPLGKKGPTIAGWARLSFADTQRADYQRTLAQAESRGGNIGVLLGPASGRLLAYDIDDDNAIEEQLSLHPWLADTLRSRGARGCQFWLRLEEGVDYPNSQAILTLKAANGQPRGELRLGGSGGAQSVIFGQHPDGVRYEHNGKAVLEISLADLYELCPSLGEEQDQEPEDEQPEIETPEEWNERKKREGREAAQQACHSERPWPVLSPEAFHGLFGRIVRLIAPATEADPVAILAQLLAAFGNAVGRRPFFYVEAAEHRTNLFECIVGQSAKGRKGTSLNHIMRLFASVDPDWISERHANGLSSGEGVIWAVRDPIFQPERNKKTGEVTEVKVDNGIEDKRLFIGETEFSQALKVMSRPTNILSSVLRNAWDSGNLRTLVKNNPARATNAHISVVGHITEEELKRELSECEMFNGFANRFLWLVTQRARFLPEGGAVPFDQFDALAMELRAAVQAASQLGEMKRDGEARAYWHQVYRDLSEEGYGLAGVACNRAEAQTLRLSMLYALCDISAVIRLEHLKAALAFWEYSRQSAYYLFGDRLADCNAQKIFDALRSQPEGMTRKQILDEVFQRNIDKRALDFAFKTLESLKVAYKQTEQTGGRPSERWFSKSDFTTKTT